MKLVKLSMIMVVISYLYGRPADNLLYRMKNYDVSVIDGSDLCMYNTNYGIWGQTPDGNAGGWWPRERTNETYIFGAGLWIGGLKRNDTIQSKWDTIVTFFYNPTNARSEASPALVPTWIRRDSIIYEPDYTDYSSAESDPQARVYLSNSDNGGYGWPIKDITQSGDTTDYILSSLDSYTRYTDLNPNIQDSGSRSLGVLVDQWTYQFNLPDIKDITFFLWKIRNISNDTLKDVYIGTCYDYDIGNEGGSNANDLVGFVRTYDFGSGPVVFNLAYQYQTVPESAWAGVDGRGTPGVIGSVFLRSSIATDTVIIIDTIGMPVGPDTILPGEPLGMTAFKIFIIGIDPRNDFERYAFMSGWDPPPLGGRYNPYMDDIYGPGDKRFIQVTGPFDMLPGKEVEFAVAVLIGRDTLDIINVAQKAITVYQNNFSEIKEAAPERSTFYASLAGNNLYLNLPVANSGIDLTITDITGRNIVRRTILNPRKRVSVDVSRLGHGVYFVIVRDGNKLYKEKFIKIK